MVEPITLSMAVIALVGSIVSGIISVLNNHGINLNCCNGPKTSKKSFLNHFMNSECCVSNVDTDSE